MLQTLAQPGTEGQALLWNAWSQDPGQRGRARQLPPRRPSLITLLEAGAQHAPESSNPAVRGWLESASLNGYSSGWPSLG